MESKSEGRNSEEKGRLHRQTKPNEAIAIVANAGFILLIHFAVIYLFCS